MSEASSFVRQVVRTCAALAAVAAAGLWASPRLPAQALPSSPGSRAAQVDALFAAWAGSTTPGCAVAVHQNGALAYLRAFGAADLEHRVPLAPESVFDVGSISKQFTAFAILLLARDGKLSVDDDVRRYVPELPDYGRTITLSHLMHHTSGVRENGYLLNLAGWRSDDIYTEADTLWVLARQRRTNFAPGDEVLYGNSAYELLREVVRRVSGTSLKAFAEARIFAPLGMRDTHFGDDHLELVPRRAQGYGKGDADRWLVRPAHTDSYGSSGLLTTVPDLLKWQKNLIDGRVGGSQAIAWMRTSGRLNDGTATTYGGGVWLREYRGLRRVGHEGFTSGFRTDTVLFPDHGLGIIVLCNTPAIAAEELSLKIADIYLGERMTGPEWAPAVHMPEAAQSALAGTWWSPITDETVRLEWREGALRQVGSPMAFVPIGNDTLRPGESRSRWQFVATKEDGGARRELRIYDAWPTFRTFVQVSEPMPAEAALREYAGRYGSDELETTYAVRVVAGQVTMAWARGYEMPLEALGGDRFVTSRGTVTFTRDASRRIDGLTLSNRRLRRFRAERIVDDSR